MVCRLAEQARLDLDEPLARWFPDVPASQRISLRQVLGHRAGLPDYGALPDYHGDLARRPRTPWTFEEFADRTYRRGLAFQPGRGWAYSNPGYMLLRSVVEREAGESFGHAVSRWIAGPLGLDSWSVPIGIDDLRELAPSRSAAVTGGGERLDVRSVYHPGWVAHGTVAGTASDTVRFLDALAGGRVVLPSTLDQMTDLSPVPPSHVPVGGIEWVTPSYGLGLMGDPDGPLGPIWGHNGGGPGYTSGAFHALDAGASACALCAREDPFLAELLVWDALSTLSAMESRDGS
jgi:D-alanyl-D-alanine carboxypeptidase